MPDGVNLGTLIRDLMECSSKMHRIFCLCLSLLFAFMLPAQASSDSDNEQHKDKLVQRFVETGGILPVYAQLPQCSGPYQKWHNCVLYSYFFNSKRLRSYTLFQHGKPNGEYKGFFFNGSPLVEKHFVDGLEDGVRIAYSSEGHIIEKTPYVAGKKHGLSKTFYSDSGSLKSEIMYVSGLKEGKSLEFYANGNLRQVAHYHNDQLNGKFYLYFPNGKLSTEDFYVNGEQSGAFKKYTALGTLVMVQHNKNGIRHGVTTFYLPNQEVFFSVVFDHGDIIYGKCGGDGSDGRSLTAAELKDFASDLGYPQCREELPNMVRRHKLAPSPEELSEKEIDEDQVNFKSPFSPEYLLRPGNTSFYDITQPFTDEADGVY